MLSTFTAHIHAPPGRGTSLGWPLIMSPLSLLLKKAHGAVPLWLSGLGIRCCHRMGSGRCCGKCSIPGPGTSACCGYSQKEKKKKGTLESKGIREMLLYGYSQICLSSLERRGIVGLVPGTLQIPNSGYLSPLHKMM